LFRFNDYSLVEKAYSVMFYVASLSLERYCVTMASRESAKKMVPQILQDILCGCRFRADAGDLRLTGKKYANCF